MSNRLSKGLALLMLIGVITASAAAQEATSAKVFPNSAGAQFDYLHESLIGTADGMLSTAVQQGADAAAGKHVPVTPEALVVDYRREYSSARTRDFGTALQRVQQLRSMVDPILRAEGVPSEIAAVMLVESGGSQLALSPKGARGLWQFMPDTARRYGLVVTGFRDDRIDVEKSTRAAARYLRDLYAEFGSWPLAFAAYNAGERAVEQAQLRVAARDFFTLSAARSLPAETRAYVPAVMSAMQLLGATRMPASPRLAARGGVVYATNSFASNLTN